jgi:hypothetical protein
VQSDLVDRFYEREERGGERRRERRDDPLVTRLNIPSHEDIRELGYQIEQLNERIDALIEVSRSAASEANSDGQEPERPA